MALTGLVGGDDALEELHERLLLAPFAAVQNFACSGETRGLLRHVQRAVDALFLGRDLLDQVARGGGGGLARAELGRLVR